MFMKIVGATVLLTDAADKVILKTELPCPIVSECGPEQSPLHLDFKATCGKGIEYCRNALGIEPKVVNIRSASRQF